MPWTWYIDNDMVFFIFIPFTILIYKKNRKIAYWIFWFMVISNIVYVFTATFASHIGATITNGKFEFEKYIYRRPWGRYGVYFFGVIAGCWYFEYKNQGKYPELAGTFGCKLFTLAHFSKWSRHGTVSYTHLTLPTIYSV